MNFFKSLSQVAQSAYDGISNEVEYTFSNKTDPLGKRPKEALLNTLSQAAQGLANELPGVTEALNITSQAVSPIIQSVTDQAEWEAEQGNISPMATLGHGLRTIRGTGNAGAHAAYSLGVDTDIGRFAGEGIADSVLTAGVGKASKALRNSTPLTIGGGPKPALAGAGSGRNAISIATPTTPNLSPQVMEAVTKPPRKTFTKAQRDRAVRTNNPPKRTDLTSNADFRGINGDVQADNTGLSIRMETRPEYKQNMTSTGQYGKGAPPQTSTTHHRMGIQDQQAFIADLTPEQLQQRREVLAEGGLFMGNVGENYEPLYDGVLTKSGRKAGMNSPDHKYVHDLSDELRNRLGIKYNKKDRSLDTINGRLIKDLPPEVREALQIQLGFQDELIIDKVQAARYKAMREAFPNLTPAERRKMILESPQDFANLSTNVLN